LRFGASRDGRFDKTREHRGFRDGDVFRGFSKIALRAADAIGGRAEIDPEGAEKRAQTVLTAMADAKFITETQAKASIGQPLLQCESGGRRHRQLCRGLDR